MIDLFGAIKFINPELDKPMPVGYYVLNRHCLVQLIRDADGALRWKWLRWCSPVEWENATYKLTRTVRYTPDRGIFVNFQEEDLQ